MIIIHMVLVRHIPYTPCSISNQNLSQDVTIVQRSSTYIMSIKEGMKRLVGGTHSTLDLWRHNIKRGVGLHWEGGPPTEIADIISSSFPNNLTRLLHVRVTKEIADADK